MSFVVVRSSKTCSHPLFNNQEAVQEVLGTELLVEISLALKGIPLLLNTWKVDLLQREDVVSVVVLVTIEEDAP
mgnify:CR=1 FL=1